MKHHAIQNALGSQMFIGLLLFFILTIMGATLSGALALNSIDFKTFTFHFPIMSLDYTAVPDYGLWIGILATSATLAAFLSNYLGKHSFITYKFVNYPEDHLQIMKFIRGNPQKAINVADEFDIPRSVATRILEDLERNGLLECIGKDEKAVYYFPFEKKQAMKK